MRRRAVEFLSLAAVLLLLLSACASTGGGGGGADAAAPAAPDYREEMGDNGLPTPRALYARYVEAIGGEDAIRAHTSSVSKGKFKLAAMGVEGDLTIHAMAPNRMHMVIETPMGSMENGYDGKVAWSVNPFTGDEILEGSAAAQARAQADYYLPLNYAAHYPTSETVEETEFGGQAAYKVKLVDAEGGESVQYFAKDSSLIIGSEVTQQGPAGAAEVTITISDYQDFDGLMVATKQVMSVQGMDIENVIESVTYDGLSEADFELPDSIKSKL
ncbi:MAG: hypothetical protein R3190_03155 [Thermoanaerobaculia bacterium]|nr:hypothetical protein [Thermoanaerobaculia bacterium]